MTDEFTKIRETQSKEVATQEIIKLVIEASIPLTKKEITVGPTTEDGKASVDLPAKSDNKDAVYVITGPRAEPMVVAFPVYKAATDELLTNVNIYPKTVPDVIKVKKESNKVSYDAGEEVRYTVTIDLPENIHGKYSNGKAFYQEIKLEDVHDKTKLTYVANSLSIEDDAKNSYDKQILVDNDGSSDEKDTISIDVAKLDSSAKQLTLNYTLKLNNNATQGVFFNKAKASVIPLNYDGQPSTNIPTAEDSISIRTGSHSFIKVNGANETETLAGAEFKVRKKGSESYLKVATTTDAVSWGTKENATIIQSDDKGEFSVVGLADGEYELIEVKAPQGFILDNQPTAFTISDKSHEKKSEKTITNREKGFLPATGGKGIIFLLVGGSVLIGGVGFYFTKGRKRIEG
ncbi:hypothetical protein CBF34_08550 [Vagococcus penaei]|uniref:Uncharacterized protein n=1 Tax=Vagococcus penaei TaxID=633807 RepID=A0A1Q2D5Z7_9ENTE|nr:SpaH/EbpB family LPXTG-anchored major pilin [Vagococcus penaei]AQP53741.1 hypothetical protein BW732_05475 [Vagococcus penaei]RSU00428.1 hypothetical protein CBF34_08550 [Vagococcus penaei]